MEAPMVPSQSYMIRVPYPCRDQEDPVRRSCGVPKANLIIAPLTQVWSIRILYFLLIAEPSPPWVLSSRAFSEKRGNDNV